MNDERRPRRSTSQATHAASMPSDAARWQAVCARDAASDGGFVFAVTTTGVYCRPSCGARRPRRAHVVFFVDGEAARVAGFRACKRCRPDAALSDAAQRTAWVTAVCRWLEAADGRLTLAELAARSGYSPFHVQRTFRAVIGMTPRAYAAGLRAERLRRELAAGRPVTAAMHRAGFASTSRLHAVAETALGMRPARARDGGRGVCVEFHTAACTLGLVLVAATTQGVCAILLGDDDAALQRELAARFPQAERRPGDRAFAVRVAAVVACVDGDCVDPGLPLDVRGTVFQQRVWAALCTIPRGAVVDYATLARQLGVPRGARAVAAACAANPLAVVVPCHRVVRGDGALAGYRWGVARKRALLQREGVVLPPAGDRKAGDRKAGGRA